MKRAKKMILSILCVSVLLCMTACARGNKDNVADDNTATGTNEEKKNDSERKREETNSDGEAPRDGVLEDVGDAVEDGARDVKDGVEDVLDGTDQNDGRTEKRIDDNKDGGNADTMNGATDNTGQTNTAR